MNRKQIIACGLIVFLILFGTAAYVSWQMMFGPMYRLGSVAAQAQSEDFLPAVTSESPGLWRVEPEISLYFQSFGQGRPVLVVHGGPAVPPSGEWAGLADLKGNFRFIYYHQRGCGRSTRPFNRFEGGNVYGHILELESTLGIGAQIADIERIRRILGEDRLLIIGHSFGGFLATLYAAEFPNHVEKLVLVAPAGLTRKPSPQTDLFALTSANLEAEDHLLFEALRADYFDFTKHFSKSEAELASMHLEVGTYILRAMGYQASSKPLLESQGLPSAGGWGAFAMYFSLGRNWEFSRALDIVKAPTLVITGVDDHLAKPGAEQYRSIDGAAFTEIKADEPSGQAGHMIFDDAPKGFGKVVAEFLLN
ncbi:MAG: alpha/beta fold hydrolase [Phycisphaerae bacterium]